METVADFIFLGSKITADGDCSYEIKSHEIKSHEIKSYGIKFFFYSLEEKLWPT